jgi:4,5-DOPA dioxygenase extradiol
MVSRLPTFFISHGGPNLLEDKSKPGKFYDWFGKLIKNEIKPKAVVIVSAHWQASGKGVFGKTHERAFLLQLDKTNPFNSRSN